MSYNLPLSVRCNGRYECSDYSDESGCNGKRKFAKKCLANAHDVIWWLGQVAVAMSGGAARGPACLPASDVMASSSAETSRTS
jgi:hypothetical protein